MGYNVNDSMVRVDRFKERGKWYDSHAVDMGPHYHNPSIHDAVRLAIQDASINMDEFIIVCLEPYHVHAHPVMLKSHLKDTDQ